MFVRRAARGAAALILGSGLMAALAGPVAAECPYLPRWPRITPAITSARGLIVGKVVTTFDIHDLDLPAGHEREYALRVTEVLRGDANIGDLVDIQYLLPNWPQIKDATGSKPTPSCSYLYARPGDVIALAFDAVQPAQWLRNQNLVWLQPRTKYNAVGLIKGAHKLRRERITLAELRILAALPRTDTIPRLGGGPRATIEPFLPLLAGVLAGIVALRRFHEYNEPLQGG